MATYAMNCMSERWLFFFEDEVCGRGAGGDLYPMGDAGLDVDDVSGVEGEFFSAFDAGTEGFAGAVGPLLGCSPCMVPPVTRVIVPLLMTIWSTKNWWRSASPVWRRTTRRV